MREKLRILGSKIVKKELKELKESLEYGYEKQINLLIYEAQTNGWEVVQVDLQTYMIGFKRSEGGYDRINVYITTDTFVTQIDHPKRGKGQLFRRRVSTEDYGELFANPRVHTGKGYYRRKERKR